MGADFIKNLPDTITGANYLNHQAVTRTYFNLNEFSAKENSYLQIHFLFCDSGYGLYSGNEQHFKTNFHSKKQGIIVLLHEMF